jgi:hypothetical protein
MLNIVIDEQNRIAILEPDGKLSESDFKSAANIIDPYINDFGTLNGLLIAAEKFPGWESFSALLSHLTFVKEHHKKISYIALVTDMAIGNVAEHMLKHFVSAKVKAFTYKEFEAAKAWIVSSSSN